MSVHSLPRVNRKFEYNQDGNSYVYTLDLFCTLIALWRVYLLWILFSKFSKWNSDRAEQVCKECHCEGGTYFAIKCELKERPY